MQGALTQNSDVNAKQDIEPTDQHSILSKVMELQISEWSYKDDPTTRHIGPMAQDFYRLFSLGHTEKGLTSIDTAGVALAALQGLHKQFEKVNNENQILKSKLHYQHERIAQLEVALSELLSRNTLRR